MRMSKAEKTKMVFSALLGDEPVVSDISHEREDYSTLLIKAMNWYSREKDSKDAKKYLSEYARKHNKMFFEQIKKADERKLVKTYGWLAKLYIEGSVLSPGHINQLNSYIENIGKEEVIASSTGKNTKKEPVVKSSAHIQDSIKEKTADLLGELEGVLDDLKTKKIDTFSLFDFLKTKEVGQVYLQNVTSWVKVKLNEFLIVYKATEKDLIQGYSNFSKKEVTFFLKLFKTMLEDIEKYSGHKKANRKPRLTKQKPASIQVKGLKYKLTDEQYNLKSVNPASIIGASQLIVFNAKTKKLGVYKTDSTQGLQVKGSSIQNYDPEQSVQKTLRDPTKHLETALKGGKVTLRKLLDDIKTVETKMTGRINVDTILVRVI